MEGDEDEGIFHIGYNVDKRTCMNLTHTQWWAAEELLSHTSSVIMALSKTLLTIFLFWTFPWLSSVSIKVPSFPLNPLTPYSPGLWSPVSWIDHLTKELKCSRLQNYIDFASDRQLDENAAIAHFWCRNIAFLFSIDFCCGRTWSLKSLHLTCPSSLCSPKVLLPRCIAILTTVSTHSLCDSMSQTTALFIYKTNKSVQNTRS